MQKIAFVGLGHMGNPMADNLLKAGFEVKIYDVVAAAMQPLMDRGAIATKSIAEVVKEADFFITMLQTGTQVSDVCLGTNGLFAHAKKSSLYIDCSSIEVSISRSLHQEAENCGINMVDAPVSGGVAGAANGTLTFMVGGHEKNFIACRSLLEKMGKKIIHAGAPGSGQAAKICNNLILGISMIAVCEGFNLGKKLGLDPQKFFEISSNASGQCWSMTSYCPVPGLVENTPSNNNFQPGFMTKMMLKDLRLAQEAAKNVAANIPLGAEAAELFSLFATQGNSEVDFSGIIKMLEGNG
jgi:3-hydroxyisobutyrate dehydrogenase